MKAIIDQHYMDDYLDSAANETEAIRRIRDVTEVHQRGGFDIRRWSSNSNTVLATIPREKLATQVQNLPLDPDYTENTLGLHWNPRSDNFMFKVNLTKIPKNVSDGKRPTKRQMLRVIMSVFDPHGFLSPFLVRSKVLLQEVWRSGIGWDDLLRDKEYDMWRTWTNSLKQLHECVIPRCYVESAEQPTRIELHTFCDASDKAFAVVSYWRFQYLDGRIKVSLINSRNRVALLKPMSVPRMELSAALIGSRWAKTIIQEHEFSVDERIFWTDSRTVLNWIRSDPRKYKAFVAHRIGEIDELTEIDEWRWVPSKENPADDATRLNTFDMCYTARWFQGPEFLRQSKEQWPGQCNLKISPKTPVEEEMKQEFVGTVTTIPEMPLPHIQRFSQWKRLRRSTAWLIMLAEKCKIQRTEKRR